MYLLGLLLEKENKIPNTENSILQPVIWCQQRNFGRISLKLQKRLDSGLLASKSAL
jgi:hypothetical protein